MNENKNRKRSKDLLLIPLLLSVFTAVFYALGFAFGILAKNEIVSWENFERIIESLAPLFFISILSPVPCIVMAILGIGFAVKANMEENSKSVGLIIAGIIEIVAYCFYINFIIYIQSI